MHEKTETLKKSKKILIIVSIMFTFIGLGITIVFLARTGVITVSLALLMLVSLVGIYVGFGVLIAAHFMVRKLN